MKMSPAGLLSLVLCLNLSAGTSGHDVSVVSLEGSEAILPCSPTNKENIVRKLFIWNKDGQKEVFFYNTGIDSTNRRSGQDEQFRGRVFYFPNQLKNSNASIVIRHTTTADSGDYTCSFPRLQPQGQIFTVKLVVRVCLKPVVRMLSITENRVLLKCEVQSVSPEPKLEWRDSDGNVLPAEEPDVSYREHHCHVSLLTTVTETTTTGFFRCVSTQEDIHHMDHDDIYVPENLFENTSSKVLTGWLVGWFIGVLTVVVILVLLVATKLIRIRINKGRPLKTEGCGDDHRPVGCPLMTGSNTPSENGCKQTEMC